MVTTRTTRRLTKTAIDALKPEAEPYVVYDSEVTGLSLRVAPSGSKILAGRIPRRARRHGAPRSSA